MRSYRSPIAVALFRIPVGVRLDLASPECRYHIAPQVHKRMALEIEQLELQVRQSREDQRLEVDRQ